MRGDGMHGAVALSIHHIFIEMGIQSEISIKKKKWTVGVDFAFAFFQIVYNFL